MVELRKRKISSQPPLIEKRSKKAKTPTTKLPENVDAKELFKKSDTSHSTINVGDNIDLGRYSGEIELNNGQKTTLKKLVDASNSGVVLFTYPRASTPGCTKQACLFRDNHDKLTSTGLSIYGISTDSPKSNTTFKSKQNLPYPLICDTASSLIASIGFKKMPKGTIRGVFAVDKAGNVLARQSGGPDTTVNAIQQLVEANS